VLVIDNCTLSALHRLNHLTILSHLFAGVIIPLAVQSEFRDYWTDFPVLDCFILKSEGAPAHDHLKKDINFLRLGKGEREAIVWSISKRLLLATDDKKARKIARKYSISIIGTLGLLIMAHEKEYFRDKSSYLHVVDSLANDLYISQKLLEWAKKV